MLQQQLLTPWMYFNKFTCSWSTFDCPSILLLTVAVHNLPTTQELLCIYREMHKVESSSSTQRRPKEMFLFYSTQARISLRQKSTPWHDFLYYGRTVTKTQRIISPTEEYNTKRKESDVKQGYWIHTSAEKRLGYPTHRWNVSHWGWSCRHSTFGSFVLTLRKESTELFIVLCAGWKKESPVKEGPVRSTRDELRKINAKEIHEKLLLICNLTARVTEQSWPTECLGLSWQPMHQVAPSAHRVKEHSEPEQEMPLGFSSDGTSARPWDHCRVLGSEEAAADATIDIFIFQQN